MEKADGFRNRSWGVLTVVLIMACLYLLALAVAEIGPGISYAILAGIGAAIVVGISVVFYKERITPVRLLFVSMIIIGVIGVRLASGGLLS